METDPSRVEKNFAGISHVIAENIIQNNQYYNFQSELGNRSEFELKKTHDDEPDFVKQLRSTQPVKLDEIDKEEFQYYIPIKGCWNNNYNQGFDLEVEADKFLYSQKRDKKVLLLLGNAGAGKTIFCQNLALKLYQKKPKSEQKLDQKHEESQPAIQTTKAIQQPHLPIVLYIPLDTFSDPLHELIENKLRRDGLTDLQIKYLKDHHQEFIFILDGYDEIKKGLYQNLYASNRLDQWNARVIISCRSSYLLNVTDYRTHFVPIQGAKVDRAGLVEISLVPFSDDQIDQYIEKYLRHCPKQIAEDKTWNAEKYQHYINNFPGVKTLIKTPYLMRILMEALPHAVKEYEQLAIDERLPLTVARLYDYFMESYFTRQRDKLLLATALPDDGHDVRIDYADFSKQLAIQMWQNDLRHVVYQPPNTLFSRPTSPWELFLGNTNKNMVRAREGAPIRRLPQDKKDDTERWAFIHYSLQEYFTSREIFDSSLAKDAEVIKKLRLQGDFLNEEKKDIKATTSSQLHSISDATERKGMVVGRRLSQFNTAENLAAVSIAPLNVLHPPPSSHTISSSTPVDQSHLPTNTDENNADKLKKTTQLSPS